jgi:hypothetical protein
VLPRKKCSNPTSSSVAADAKVEMCPPIPAERRFARTTMAIAFQRIKLLTPLDRPIAGVRRLALRGDRVDVGGVGRERRDDLIALTPFDQPPQQEHRPLAARGLGDGLKRVDPLLRFGSIAVLDRRTGHGILE